MYLHNFNSMLSTRVNIMFDRKIWNRLKAIAQKQSVTTSELVRRAVLDQYLSDIAKKRRRAYEEILAIRPKAVKGKIDYKELINDGRRI